MDDIKIRTLAETPFETLHSSWVKAFSDYQVKIQIPIEALKAFFRQNSVSLEASVGAFLKEELVGFWINGLRTVNGQKTAYDSGTAIWPEHRGKGISKMLAAESNRILKGLGVKEYILEVLSENKKAYDIYLKDGFKVSRNFICFETNKPSFGEINIPAGVTFEDGPFDPEIAGSFPDTEYTPSWQNNLTAVANIKELLHVVIAREGEKIVGFGLFQSARGRVPMIGVLPDLWDSNVPSEILRRLCSTVGEGKEIAIINVDKRAARTQDLFKKHGFGTFVEQYEMRKQF